MLRPNWEETKYLFHERIDWSDHYTMHLSSRYVIILSQCDFVQDLGCSNLMWRIFFRNVSKAL